MKNSQTPDLPAIQQQVKQQSTLLSNLKVEVVAHTRRGEQVRAEIESKTAELLAARRAELDFIEDGANQRIEAASAIEHVVKDNTNVLEGILSQRQSTITALNTEITEYRRVLQTAKDATELEQSRLEPLKIQLAGANAALAEIRERTTTLQTHKEELTRTVDQLKTEASQIALETATAKEAFEKIQIERQRELATVDMRARKLKEEIRESQTEIRLVQEDLAARIRAADERDRNLKAREYKVSRDEDTISSNAQLLNL